MVQSAQRWGGYNTIKAGGENEGFDYSPISQVSADPPPVRGGVIDQSAARSGISALRPAPLIEKIGPLISAAYI